jgi:hypothetical protein
LQVHDASSHRQRLTSLSPRGQVIRVDDAVPNVDEGGLNVRGDRKSSRARYPRPGSEFPVLTEDLIHDKGLVQTAETRVEVLRETDLDGRRSV